MKKTSILLLLALTSLFSCETTEETGSKETMYISSITKTDQSNTTFITQFIYEEDKITLITENTFTQNDDSLRNYNTLDSIYLVYDEFDRVSTLLVKEETKRPGMISYDSYQFKLVREGDKLSILNDDNNGREYQYVDRKVFKQSLEIKDSTFIYGYNIEYYYTSDNIDSCITKYLNGKEENYKYSEFDNYNNPLNSINTILGFPFFKQVEALSENNASYRTTTLFENEVYERIDTAIYEYEYLDNFVSSIARIETKYVGENYTPTPEIAVKYEIEYKEIQ